MHVLTQMADISNIYCQQLHNLDKLSAKVLEIWKKNVLNVCYVN